MSEDVPVYQPPSIKGYRSLNEAEVQLINAFKTLGGHLGDALDTLAGIEGVDQRRLAIGRTDLQKGLMSVIRAVAKPEGF